MKKFRVDLTARMGRGIIVAMPDDASASEAESLVAESFERGDIELFPDEDTVEVETSAEPIEEDADRWSTDIEALRLDAPSLAKLVEQCSISKPGTEFVRLLLDNADPDKVVKMFRHFFNADVVDVEWFDIRVCENCDEMVEDMEDLLSKKEYGKLCEAFEESDLI